MEEIIMASLPNKELNRLIKIEIVVENLIENGILDEDVFEQYLKEAQIEEVQDDVKIQSMDKRRKMFCRLH